MIYSFRENFSGKMFSNEMSKNCLRGVKFGRHNLFSTYSVWVFVGDLHSLEFDFYGKFFSAEFWNLLFHQLFINCIYTKAFILWHGNGLTLSTFDGDRLMWYEMQKTRLKTVKIISKKMGAEKIELLIQGVCESECYMFQCEATSILTPIHS